MPGVSNSDFDIIEFRRQLNLLVDELESGIPILQKASNLLKDPLESYPHSSRLLCLKGDIEQLNLAADLGLFDKLCPELVSLYKEALCRDPMNWEAYESLGVIADIQERYSEAELWFRKAIAASENIDSYLGLSKALFQQGKPQAAREVVDQAYDYLDEQKTKVDECASMLDNPLGTELCVPEDPAPLGNSIREDEQGGEKKSRGDLGE